MTRDEIAAVVPHAGAMCLLEQTVSWDATRIHCRSATQRAAQHPLGRGNALAAVHLVEYAAQAAALHCGLQSATTGSAVAGMLAALNDVRWCEGAVGDLHGPLDIHAEQALASRQGFIYHFEIFGRHTQLVRGRLTIAATVDTP